MESGNAKLATLNQRRDLRDRVNMTWQTSVDELGMGVAEDLRVANHAFVVRPTLPGADNRFFQRGRTHQRRIGVKSFKIEPDRKSFAQLGAVV
jgi:hypothetical protein